MRMYDIIHYLGWKGGNRSPVPRIFFFIGDTLIYFKIVLDNLKK